MQLGTRWSVGAEPPSKLPDAVCAAVRDVESELGGVDTALWRWTLTWPEGKPAVELDDGTTIRYNQSAGTASVTPPPAE